MTEEKKQPLKKFRAGGVTATIWKNIGDDFVTYSINIERSYKQDEEWKTTNAYNKNDLSKVRIVSRQAEEFLYNLKNEDTSTKEESVR